MDTQQIQELEQRNARLEQALTEMESDLKKSRRRIKIEESLEKVRARTMTMRDSSELSETSTVLFQQLKILGINPIRASVGIFDDVNSAMELWLTTLSDSQEVVQVLDYVNLHVHKVYENVIPAREQNKPFALTILTGKEVRDYYQTMSTYLFQPNQEFNQQECFYAFFFPQGALNLITGRELTQEECEIMIRLAQLFGLIYTRFLDLKKVEARMREATIESAMERIRFRAMSMEYSREVDSVISNMFSELEILGIETVHCGFSVGHDTQLVDDWSIHYSNSAAGEQSGYHIDLSSVSLRELLQKAWEKKEEVFFYSIAGEEKSRIYVPRSEQSDRNAESQHAVIPDQYFHGYSFGEGVIWTFSLTLHSEEDRSVLKKFSVVFSLVYRRFLDLRKAEEQARIASIEAALEKAREKAMGMRHSDDLTGTADAVFSELRSLRISPHRGGVGLVKKHTGKVLIYATSCSDAKGNLTVIGSEVFQDHRVLDEIYQRWKQQEEYYPILDRGVPGLFLPGSPADFLLPEGVRGGRYFGYFLPFSEGFLYGWLEKPVTDADIDILDRFKTIVDLALRRYLELQKSELITRESLRQASLDRIRAEIASMRSTNDLERIIPLVWKELNTLGVPFIRCGVFIMDEQRQEIQAFLSAPEGESRAAFHLPFHTAGIIQEILEHWRKQVLLTQHWEKKDFDEWLDMLVEKGAMKANEQYITNAHPEKFDLHFFPFRQGMLYVGNTGSLGNEEIETVQAVTNSFATAYARYEDFTKLELAKQQVEKTLADLKQAQARLVQSEKLASLGELTAGIAHEIQNPLNFVNNFSEVSTELAAELEEAAARGNLEGIRTLAADIRSNQQKINEHGRRADAIVKSMFLHSRTGSGQKESTDINELCNEYLRLAYHASLSGRQGMQSKDLAAKVLVQTSFDKEAGRVDIIPQEIGRVLLNLYNNAFYALTDPQNASVSGYEPRLSVSTRKTGDTVIIEVKDNGPGIPEKIRDKIFQPFFTTKPTGQGTGLGLSLSYDIINAHGGEIRLESEEGEGTTFSVILPNG